MPSLRIRTLFAVIATLVLLPLTARLAKASPPLLPPLPHRIHWHRYLQHHHRRHRHHRHRRPSRVAEVLATARRMIGTPYVWGGDQPGGFDCSGLVRYVFSRVGVSLPHSSFAQMALGRWVSRPRPGDVLFFWNGEHVAVYVGRGEFIDAPHTGARVGERSITSYGGYYEARRYIG